MENYIRIHTGYTHPAKKTPAVRFQSHPQILKNTSWTGAENMDIAPSNTTLYHFPMEMLDIILQKSYLLMSLNSERNQRNKEVIRYLASVDVCFSRRISRRRFKKAIWRYLGDYFEKAKKTSAIIRNNWNYLLENIQPNDELIKSLLSLNCITEEKSNFIQRQRSIRDKNAEILLVLRSVDKMKFSNFVKCLRQTNQTILAGIIENGGVVIKVKVRNRDKTSATSMNLELFHEEISDPRMRTRSRSPEAVELISQLKYENIEILNCKLDRKTVVISTWCHSQEAVQRIQSLFETNRLKSAGFTHIRPLASQSLHSKWIISASNRFNKTVVVCPIYFESTERFLVEGINKVYGVTKLRNEIYFICRTLLRSLIRVYEDQEPFRLQMEIETNEFKYPVGIVSSDKENCLYVSDSGKSCVWKITRECYDQPKIIKWLTTKFKPSNLSMSSNGQLLMVSASLSMLMIYGSDAELIRFIYMPRDVEELRYAVQTYIGNFIILHLWMEHEGKRRSSWIFQKWVVSELSKDGQTIIRRFIPSEKNQILVNPRYLAFDGDNQVFVADYVNGRVIVLNSDLIWNGVFCTGIKIEIRRSNILCYDEDTKQLIVVEAPYYACIANVYTFSRY